jgi:hypothetical protein
MSGFKIDVKSAPWWSMGQVQYEVVSPDGRCVYHTTDFGLSLLVRDVWESLPAWDSLLKEKVKMTDEQKDAIVKAAQEWDKVMRDCLSWGERANRHGMEQANLAAAVRAAEQPRWSAGLPASPTTSIYLRTSSSNCAVGWISDYGLADRIARLLNEDDAKGGSK